METVFSKEQIRKILKENDLKDGKSIADFLKKKTLWNTLKKEQKLLMEKE